MPSPAKRFHLRWRFDFHGRPSVCGLWSNQGTPEGAAARQNKEGLAVFRIEGQDVATGEIRTLAACDGHDFVNFQWMAGHITTFGATVRSRTRLLGAKILTRETEHQVFPDGRVIIVQRTEAEKRLNFATFGR